MTGKKENLVQFSERLKSLVPTGSGRDFAKKLELGTVLYITIFRQFQAPPRKISFYWRRLLMYLSNGWLLARVC